MPKKTKTEQTNAIATEPNAQPSAPTEAPVPKQAAAKKLSGKKTGARKSGGKKSAAKKATKKTSAKAATASAKRTGDPSDDEIRLRAYFIAERRMQMSLDGDPANDWIQAREELIAELGSGNGSH